MDIRDLQHIPDGNLVVNPQNLANKSKLLGHYSLYTGYLLHRATVYMDKFLLFELKIQKSKLVMFNFNIHYQ